MDVSKTRKVVKDLKLGVALKKKKVGELTYGDLQALGKAIQLRLIQVGMCCCQVSCCAAAVTSFKEMGEVNSTTSPGAL